MKLLRIGLNGVAFALISACATTFQAPLINQTDQLNADEGILLLAVTSPNEQPARFFFRGTQRNFESPPYPTGSHVHLLRVPAGKYEMTKIYVGPLRLMAKDFLTFEVKPGHVTYPGDLFMDGMRFGIAPLNDARQAKLAETQPEFAELPMIFGSSVERNRRAVDEPWLTQPNVLEKLRPEDGREN